MKTPDPSRLTATDIAHGGRIRDSIDEAVYKERQRQIEKWGEQSWPLVRMKLSQRAHEEGLKWERRRWEERQRLSRGHSWDNILLEEVYEVFTASDLSEARTELIQVMAVCRAIVEDLDKKAAFEENAVEDLDKKASAGSVEIKE